MLFQWPGYLQREFTEKNGDCEIYEKTSVINFPKAKVEKTAICQVYSIQHSAGLNMDTAPIPGLYFQ